MRPRIVFAPRLAAALLAALALTGAVPFQGPNITLDEPLSEMSKMRIAMRMCYVDKMDDSRFVKLSAALAASDCVDGAADGFPCRNVDLLAALPLQDLGATRGSDMWGWTDPQNGREIVIYNMNVGAAFIDISDPTQPVHLGTLPVPGQQPVQGDVKVYGNYALIGGERAEDHGIQIFDLRRLRQVTSPPETFTADAHYTGFGRSHNLAVNETSGFAYGVSTTTCNDGLHIVDVSSPLAPAFAGCVDQVGFIHDAQCVDYAGGDPDYAGREICFNSGGASFSIVDVSDKSAPRLLAQTDYPGRAFVHQGWLTEDQRYFLIDDEGDELESGSNTRTYVFDVRDLDTPTLAGVYTSESPSVDHNLYIVGDHVFEANYASGLRILHLDDPSTGSLSEVAFFDVVPESDDPGFGGAWTAYPFFASGNVVISTISQGIFVVRPRLAGSCSLALGDPEFCRACGPCGVAEGGCRSDDDCRTGLLCAEDFGPSFGLGRHVDVCVEPGGVALDYTAAELDAVTTGGAELGGLHATAINDSGQVVGWASAGGSSRRAVRFTPGVGTEDLTPAGAGGAEALRVNAAGDVFGRLVRTPADGTVRQTGLFRYSDTDGFDFLELGSRRALKTRFELLDVNDAGDVVGVWHRNRDGRLVPYLYTADTGWIDLTALDARLGEQSTLPIAVNNAADILLTTAPRPSGAQDTYLLRGGETLIRLGNFGRRVNVPLDFNDRSQVVGFSETAERDAHAYFARPGRALLDLHRGRFASSYAGWITGRSVVGGVFDDEALFTYDARRAQKVKVVAGGARFAGLLPAGAELGGIEVIDMNERLEFVGRVLGRLSDDELVSRFFYASPAAGVADLQEVVDASGTPAIVESVTAINNRGAILLRSGSNAAEAGAVVLSPVAGPAGN